MIAKAATAARHNLTCWNRSAVCSERRRLQEVRHNW